MKILYFALVYSHLVAVLGKNIPFTWGIGIDVLLIICAFRVLFSNNSSEKKANIKPNVFFILSGLWMSYIVLELLNPEVNSYIAWLYAMRALALYGFLIALIGMKSELNLKDFYKFYTIWLLFAFLGGLYGMKQQIFGLFNWEQNWLAQGAWQRHVLWGKLRVFSFYSDASTYGNAMGQAFTASSILLLGPFKRKIKVLLFFCSIVTLIGLALSGTRGAYAVPGAGLILFVLVSRSQWLRIVILSSMVTVFCLLKFTYIGQNVYSIQRMRSSLDSNDPSLQLRLFNREQLTKYLRDKPFGGGVGSVGLWGQRFSPTTWLANFYSDGGYTRLRAECGIVGKNLFIFINLILLLRGARLLIKTGNEETYILSAAFLCGFGGILASNYGNSTLSQLPNSIIIYIGLIFIEKIHQGQLKQQGKPSEIEGDHKKLNLS